MTLIGAQNIVENELNKIAASEWQKTIQSRSTDSKYYKLINDKVVMEFRISDHPTNHKLSTLIINKKVKEITIRNYVKNRVRDFHQKSLDITLGLKKGK